MDNKATMCDKPSTAAEMIIRELKNNLDGLVYLQNRIKGVNHKLYGPFPENEEVATLSPSKPTGFSEETTILLDRMDHILQECHSRFDKIENFF